LIEMSRWMVGRIAAVAVILASLLWAPSPTMAAGPRPLFQMPFRCGQLWEASTYNGHWPNQNAIDLGMWYNSPNGKVNISAGQQVLASAAGTVSQVGRDGEVTNPPHGNFVYIDHGGGWVTNYLHLRDAPLVAQGQVVNAGQQIGVVGNTGTGEMHLHYSQWSDGNAVRVQFNGSDINTWTGNLSPWGNGERLTSANCGSFIPRHSQKCLTAADTFADGWQVTQWACNARATQLWSLVYLGFGHYRVQSNRNSKCLDVQGGVLVSGQPVVLNGCNGSGTQSWLIARQPAGQNTWWDYRVNGSLCLSVQGSSRSDGAGLVLSVCQGFSSQVFAPLTPTGP